LEPLSDKALPTRLSAQHRRRRPIQKQAMDVSTPSHGHRIIPSSGSIGFTVGYQTGDPNKCDTFATGDLG